MFIEGENPATMAKSTGLGIIVGQIAKNLILANPDRTVYAVKRLMGRKRADVADVQAGIVRHVSVGYQVNKMEKVEEVDKVPVYRAARWMPTEISLVPVAFDDGAVVRGRKQPEPYEVEIVDLRPEGAVLGHEQAQLGALEQLGQLHQLVEDGPGEPGLSTPRW